MQNCLHLCRILVLHVWQMHTWHFLPTYICGGRCPHVCFKFPAVCFCQELAKLDNIWQNESVTFFLRHSVLIWHILDRQIAVKKCDSGFYFSLCCMQDCLTFFWDLWIFIICRKSKTSSVGDDSVNMADVWVTSVLFSNVFDSAFGKFIVISFIN